MSTTHFVFNVIGILILLGSMIWFNLYGFDVAPLMRKLPKQNLSVPAWLAYLIIVPGLGWVVAVVVLAFAFPKAVERTYTDSKMVQSLAIRLRWIGLGACVLMLVIYSRWYWHFTSSITMKDMWLSAQFYEMILLPLAVIILLFLYSRTARAAVNR